MGRKRKHRAIVADDNDQTSTPGKKRYHSQKDDKPARVEGKRDPVYGQRFAFPGLDSDDDANLILDDDVEQEDNGDVLAYLRSVRQEANNVPSVLVAPKAGPQLPPHLQTAEDNTDHGIYNNGVGDSRGYYQDGAYTAAPSTPSVDSSDLNLEYGKCDPSDPDQVARLRALARKSYYDAILNRFLSLRAVLHRKPPPHLIDALPRENGTFVGSFGPKTPTFRVWSHRLRHTDPHPVQIASLDTQSVLKLIRILLGGKFMRRGHALRERTSRWIWALLARLPPRGELRFSDIGWIRELGRRAILMMVSLADVEALQEQVNGDLEGEQLEGDADNDAEEPYVAELVVDEEEEEVAPRILRPTTKSSVAIASTPRTDRGEDMDTSFEKSKIVKNDTTNGPNEDPSAHIEAAKARLLARLEEATVAGDQNNQTINEDGKSEKKGGYDEQQKAVAVSRTRPRNEEGEANESKKAQSLQANKANDSSGADDERLELNMRVTLNMILTVAGEFYGQRDLLEFRNPFPAV